jgi:4-diphosphocytidyl-2-C-methyl-D-erythritol kinase
MAELRAWGAELGSDISFFFSSGTAYCTGRGEQIESLPSLGPGRPITVLKPAEGLSTALVYKTLDLGALSAADPAALLARMRAPGGLLDAGAFVNDLEPPALAAVPRLAAIQARLRAAGWRVVMMSGSGTSIFAMGAPDGAPALEGWSEELGACVFPTTFAARAEDDEKVWYGEQ